MKKFLLITGYIFAGFILCFYLAFLFVLPNVINLNEYVPEVQKLVKDNSGLNIDLTDIKLFTTPLLEAGIKSDGIKITNPDNSTVFSSDELKAKIFLPSLLWYQVFATKIKVENPFVNAEIIDSEQYKAVRTYEDFVNNRRKDKLANPEKYEIQSSSKNSFDISKIKITLPNIKLHNYLVVANDVKTGHNISLSGSELKLAYLNGKKAKLKTDANFSSDDTKKISANLDINTFLPKFTPAPKEEEDLEAVFAVPFVNPVTAYQKYELKSNINSKLKIRQDKKSKKIKLYGFANIDNTTLKISDLQLPESHFRLKSRKYYSEIDTNLFVTDKEYINILSKINYGRKPFLDLTMNSNQVYLDNILKIAQAYLDSVNIQNDIKNMTASGYLLADANIRTNYKSMVSEGKIFVKNGNITNSGKNILFDRINADLYLDGNELMIKNTSLSVNNRPLSISGRIDSDSIANLYIKGGKIPLTGLYNAFAPRDIKNKYSLNSGFLTVDTKINGKIDNLMAILKSNIENLDFRDRAGEFVITNKSMRLGFANYSGELHGRLNNTGFNAKFPKRHSVIKNEELKIDLDNDKITIHPSNVSFNKNSIINISGGITEAFSKMNAVFTANGKFSASDLGDVLLQTAVPYFDIKGFLPFRAKCFINGNKLKAIAQGASDPQNYITPVNMDDFRGKQTIAQFVIDKNKNTLKISNTGLFTRTLGKALSDNLAANTRGAKEIIKVRGIISNLNSQPFVSLIKIVFPNEMSGSVHILKKSRFTMGGNLHIFGKPENLKITGKIDLKKLSFPELLTTMDRVIIDMGSKQVTSRAHRINANGNDISIIAISDWDKIFNLDFNNVKIFSRYIDVNKILKVPQAGEKAFPGSAKEVRNDNGVRPDNPVKIKDGSLRLNKIVMDNLQINNTSSKLRMNKSTVYLDKLKTKPFGGEVFGDVSYHILDSKVRAKVSGQNFDIEKVLLDVMNMKDMLSGTANFIADIVFEGTDITNQLKSLKGFIDFNVVNGQLGPFGKIENFLMAENIRENAFFSSTIGSVITNLVTFDTSRYNSLFGHLTFENGFVNISPVKSQGNVMSMFIIGKAGLLDNSADMKVRIKLASAFSDKLGPLANINPINIVKKTPGLNIVAVKMFALFCEEVSEEEMSAIPELGEGKSDENATKIQIKLRGDTRKPLKMIKSFKWLALDSEIQSAKEFVDTLPTPEAGEENLSVEELVQLREQQAQEKAAIQAQNKAEAEAKRPLNRLKNAIKKDKNEISK